MIDAFEVHTAVNAACPILGVSIADENDRATWTFSPRPEATTEQIEAGKRALVTFDKPQSEGGVLVE